jgi:hypothetical protein
MITKQQFEKLLPLACEWVEQQEKVIINLGVELNDDQKIDAHFIGIKNIEKVRLLKVGSIPAPVNPELIKAAQLAGLLTESSIGITFRYGIYIHEKFWNQRKLIVHELTHTMQYERLGGIESFLKQYLEECITVGYPLGELEQEARRMEKVICR